MSIRGQLIAAQQQQQRHQSPSPGPPPQNSMSEQQHQPHQLQHQQSLPMTSNSANNPLNSSFKLNSNGSSNGMMMQKSVAIVTPQRSNSMDYLNFEERRQLIASSLSLSEILSGQGGGAPPAKESAVHHNNNDAGLGNTIVPHD